LCAIGAFLSRGIGDFLIQRSTRKIGNWETLLVVGLFAIIFLFPFIYHDLHLILLSENIFILLAVAVIFFVMSLLNFESLRRGKISVVEPIFTLEVPVAIFLAFIFFNEIVSWQQ
jgi:drug/metabolite transporter (DMT)-like permease